MTGRMARYSNYEYVTILSGANLSDVIDMSDFSGGVVIFPGTWTAADLGFHVAEKSDGTFVPLKTHDDAYVVIDGPDASTAFEMPPEVFGCRFVKLWSTDGAGANANQGGDRSLTVLLKA